MKKQIVEVSENTSGSAETSSKFNFDGMIHLSKKFAALNRLITRDLNGTSRNPTFYLYTKDQITQFLQNPYSNQKNLRNAAIYIYGASSHFRRLIQYFTGLTDLSYVLSPYRIDTSTAKSETIGKQYRKTLNMLSAMDIKNQFPKIITVCLREDTFYGTMWVTNDNITIQQLPSDYCDIAVVEGNVLNVSFDFSYFDSNGEYLTLYPPEFEKKYRLYQKDRTKMKWQELDSPTSFAVKCNTDILNYSIPPFAGMFREVYDLEDLNVKTNRSVCQKWHTKNTPLIAGNPLEPYKPQRSHEKGRRDGLKIIRIGRSAAKPRTAEGSTTILRRSRNKRSEMGSPKPLMWHGEDIVCAL